MKSPFGILVWVVVHYSDIIMSICSNHGISIVCSGICSDADKKNQSSASLAFVRGIHRWLMDSPHKGPVMQKLFLLCHTIHPKNYAHYSCFVVFYCGLLLKDTPISCSFISFSLTIQGSFCEIRSANERRHYIVTSSHIGWVHLQNDLLPFWGHYKLAVILEMTFLNSVLAIYHH